MRLIADTIPKITNLQLISKQGNSSHSCNDIYIHHISSVIRTFFFLPKQSQKSSSIIQDGSRSLGLLSKDKTLIIAEFHRTDVDICNHSRERKSRLIAE